MRKLPDYHIHTDATEDGESSFEDQCRAAAEKGIDEILIKVGVITPRGRRGSELAISLFCDIVCGAHPVEAFIRANLDVVPKKRL